MNITVKVINSIGSIFRYAFIYSFAVMVISAGYVWAGEKHALLVIGEPTLSIEKQRVVEQLLQSQKIKVHKITPKSAGEVKTEISRLGAISADPNQPPWDLFVFYFIGHGGQGIMNIAGKKKALLTYENALQIFEEVYVDSWTHVYDMCHANDAVTFVRQAMDKSKDDPYDPDLVGWILAASGYSTTGMGLDATYGELYTEALKKCLGGLASVNANSLHQCILNERFHKPWWYKSSTSIHKIGLVQPSDVPVF